MEDFTFVWCVEASSWTFVSKIVLRTEVESSSSEIPGVKGVGVRGISEVGSPLITPPTPERQSAGAKTTNATNAGRRTTSSQP